MIKTMREAGCVVIYNISNAISKGIALANDQTLLKQNGGSLNLDFLWFQSMFWTKAKQPVSPSFLKDIGFSFYWAIKDVIDACDAPDDLVIKIDKAPLPFILLRKYTMKNLCH